ncbi:MAG TPA: hypothetical protein VJN64_15155 [Terriglobales bacterium]|nr:hypothetical protein [Terriglobales bacterium]
MKIVTPGTFIALGRAISKERIELQVGEVQTSHPKPGSTKHAAAPPPTPEKIRELLPKLADLPQVAEEKARTVADLQAQIRKLGAELVAEKRRQPETKADPQDLARQVDAAIQKVVSPLVHRDNERTKALESHFASLLKLGESLEGFTAVFDSTLKAAGENLGGYASIELKDFREEVLHQAQVQPKRVTPAQSPAPVSPKAEVVSIRSQSQNGPQPKLRDGAVRMLAAAAQFYPEWVPKPRVASLASLKLGGTFSTYQSDLSIAGLVAIRGGGKGVELLRAIIARNGEAIAKQELSEEAGIELGGTFSTYLSDLRTAGLIVDGHRGIAANRETLFL